MPGSSSASPATGHACSPSNAHASYPGTNSPSPEPEPYGGGGMTWPVPPLEPGSAVTSTLRTSGARSSRRGPFSAQHIPTDDDAVIKRRDRKHRAIPAPQAEPATDALGDVSGTVAARLSSRSRILPMVMVRVACQENAML